MKDTKELKRYDDDSYSYLVQKSFDLRDDCNSLMEKVFLITDN